MAVPPALGLAWTASVPEPFQPDLKLAPTWWRWRAAYFADDPESARICADTRLNEETRAACLARPSSGFMQFTEQRSIN